MNQQSKTIAGFDILKMFMALCIVAIHVRPFENAPLLASFFSPLISSAVPVFFLLSSFFIFKKMEENGYEWHIFGTWLKRICQMYLFWLIVNLPFVIADKAEVWFVQPWYMAPIYIIRDILFASSFAGSWFLSSLVVGVCIVFLLKKYLHISNVVLITTAFVLYIYLYFQQIWPEKFRIVYDWIAINIRPDVDLTFFTGIIWAMFGVSLASKRFMTFLQRIKDSSFGILLVCLSIVIFYMCRMCNAFQASVLWTIGLAISLFILGYIVKLPDSKIYIRLRKMSILFYFQHFIYLNIYYYLSVRDIVPKINEGGYRYLLVLAFCTIGAIIIMLLSEKKYFKCLKYSF